jgi:hypothetical protein
VPRLTDPFERRGLDPAVGKMGIAAYFTDSRAARWLWQSTA